MTHECLKVPVILLVKLDSKQQRYVSRRPHVWLLADVRGTQNLSHMSKELVKGNEHLHLLLLVITSP